MVSSIIQAHFLFKIQPNISEQEKNWQRIYDLLNIFTNPSTRAGYDTRSIFKQSLTGLNSDFSFS